MKRKVVVIVGAISILMLLSLTAFADSRAGGGIFSRLGEIARFLKRLIVPDANYFHNQLASLSKHANDRLGGVAYLYLMMNDFFHKLNNVPPVDIVFTMPNGFLFPGYKGFSVDIFTSAKPFLNLIRNVSTSALAVFTVITCYHKLRTFFQQGDHS